MNQYTFELTAQHRPEVLERVLRVIRLRGFTVTNICLLYTSPSPRDRQKSRMPSSA